MSAESIALKEGVGAIRRWLPEIVYLFASFFRWKARKFRAISQRGTLFERFMLTLALALLCGLTSYLVALLDPARIRRAGRSRSFGCDCSPSGIDHGIRYASHDLGTFGRCRASFIGFYRWTNDAMSFELSEAAASLIALSRRPDQVSPSYIRIRPLWVLIGVSFTDIFGAAGRQDLLLIAGQSRPLNDAELGERTRADTVLHLERDRQGRVVIHRILAEPVSSDCANALRVMGRINWLRMVRHNELPQDTAESFLTEAP